MSVRSSYRRKPGAPSTPGLLGGESNGTIVVVRSCSFAHFYVAMGATTRDSDVKNHVESGTPPCQRTPAVWGRGVRSSSAQMSRRWSQYDRKKVTPPILTGEWFTHSMDFQGLSTRCRSLICADIRTYRYLQSITATSVGIPRRWRVMWLARCARFLHISPVGSATRTGHSEPGKDIL